jgi:hypothetical protein
MDDKSALPSLDVATRVAIAEHRGWTRSGD